MYLNILVTLKSKWDLSVRNNASASKVNRQKSQHYLARSSEWDQLEQLNHLTLWFADFAFLSKYIVSRTYKRTQMMRLLVTREITWSTRSAALRHFLDFSYLKRKKGKLYLTDDW